MGSQNHIFYKLLKNCLLFAFETGAWEGQQECGEREEIT